MVQLPTQSDPPLSPRQTLPTMYDLQVNPYVVVELLSPGTQEEDLGRTVQTPGNPPTKWQVYEQILRIPYSIVFSRYTNELQAFHLVGGHYVAMNFIDNRLLMPELELSLGLWQGSFRGINCLWLRWMTAEGELILTPEEEAVEAQERAERLAARLQELGVDPDELE
ncbi:MAG: Uma2 family endonuclease [Coleofasciculus sp. C1-SOL-03]